MKHLSAFLGTALFLSAAAQPMIQFSNWPTVPQTFSARTITNSSALPPLTTGFDQVWNATAATTEYLCEATLGPSAGTPYAATYPDANWAFLETVGTNSGYTYIQTDATGVETVATYVPISPNAYTDYQRILQFPMSFGDSFTDTYASPTHTGTDTWTYNGHGTLITPAGSFPDQLMLTSTSGDIILWNAQPLALRLLINNFGSSITFFGPSTVGIPEDHAAHATLAAWPVPANTQLNLRGVRAGAQWTVRDLQGRTLLQGRYTLAQPLDIAALATGEYLFTAIDARGAATVRFQKQ